MNSRNDYTISMLKTKNIFKLGTIVIMQGDIKELLIAYVI